VLQLAFALATALALAAGVILGQYLARPLKWEAHRSRRDSRALAWLVRSHGRAKKGH
jgi:hypothetical protein